MFESFFLLLVLELTFSFKETHAHNIVFIFRAHLFLFLENEIVQVYFDASNGHVITTRERLEVFHTVATENYIFHVALNKVGKHFLLIVRASHATPWLAGEGLIGVEISTSLVRI